MVGGTHRDRTLPARATKQRMTSWMIIVAGICCSLISSVDAFMVPKAFDRRFPNVQSAGSSTSSKTRRQVGPDRDIYTS